MTTDKAIYRLECDCKQMDRECDCKKDGCDGCYIKIAIDAVEKQVPKKPILNDRDDAWKCPCCGEEDYMPYHMYKFCPNCGQAIDWDETKKTLPYAHLCLK